MDEEEDGEIGLPGRLWGSYGGSAVPMAITVQNSGFYSADFNLGFPIEQESNGSAALAVGRGEPTLSASPVQ
jgi:hypothetical protein